MYDTVLFVLREVDVDFEISFLEEVSCYLEDVSWKSSDKLVGRTKNMRVIIAGDKLSVTGSIAKWYKGNNVESLSLVEIEDAIKRLGRELHVPIEKAKVYRIDVGMNFEMKYSPELYLIKLGYLDNFQRCNMFHDSLYYNKKVMRVDRQLIFYDKVRELKSHNEKYTEYMPEYILRYELKLLKNIKYQLKREVRVADLYDPSFYRIMLDFWYNTYTSIEKRRDKPPRLDFSGRKKKFYDSAVRYCCNAENISDYIEELSLRRVIDAKTKFELKKIVKNALKEENYSAEDSSIIDELTVCVEEEYARQLEMIKKFENE